MSEPENSSKPEGAQASTVRVMRPEEFTGGDTLVFYPTQTGLPATEQRKLVKAWCEVLPTLQLRHVVFTSKVSQDLFDAVTRIAGLERLVMGWSSIKSIESIRDCTSLVELEIGSSPSLTGVSYLSGLRGLRRLKLVNIKQARDLSFVAPLDNLVEFGACGSTWTDQDVEDLWPLQGMRKLEVLWLIGTRVLRDGLRPLYELPRLRELHSGYNFRASDFAALRVAVPTLVSGSPFESHLIAEYCKP